MHRIVLDSETDWEGWRTATRALVLASADPDEVRWSVRAQDSTADALPEGSGSFSISRTLVSLAGLAIQARDPTRLICSIGLSGAPMPGSACWGKRSIRM